MVYLQRCKSYDLSSEWEDYKFNADLLYTKIKYKYNPV